MVIPKLNMAIEKLTGYMGVIDSDHAYVHQGIAFTSIINTTRQWLEKQKAARS